MFPALLPFLNPADHEESVNGTIKFSGDDGKTSTKSYRYSNTYPAFSGYSDIARLENGDIAVLFEQVLIIPNL